MNERKGQRGQVLVIFTIFIVALLGFAALAIDVSGVWSEVRHERAIADAAALAGASDNFREGSLLVDNAEWTKARKHAMENLVTELSPGGVLPCSTPDADGNPSYPSDVVNCPIPGSSYYVSVFAPAPTCQTLACDAIRSVQVTVRQPKHQLSFANLFGQVAWNLPVTSVAERSIGSNYAFVTLRPPAPGRGHASWCDPNCDANDDDIYLDGTNTKLTVRGDMGTNTNMILTACTTAQPCTDLTTPVVLDSGNFVERYDAFKGWTGVPRDKQIAPPIQDPGYPYPTPPNSSDTLRNFSTEAAAELSSTACAAEVAKAVGYGVDPAGIATGNVICYRPGAYNFGLTSPSHATVMLFSPGVYFLNGGFQVGNNVKVFGGYEAGKTGVAFVFPQTCNPACTFAGNAADVIAINAGSAYPSGSGTYATAATNWDNTLVETNGRVHFPMTLLVQRDANCTVGPEDPAACRHDENQNNQLRLPGGGSLWVTGIQYAPTDNVQISGGASSAGYLGQIWSWTVKYTGGSNIFLIGVGDPEPGVLRLASPCSPNTACVNPEATATLP